MPYDKARGRKRRPPMDTEVYGGGFDLVDLESPVPLPNPEWIKARLAEREIECEYPSCNVLAVTMVIIKNHKHAPFVCAVHARALADRTVQTEMAYAMVGEIIRTSYGDRPPEPEQRVRQYEPTYPVPAGSRVQVVSFDRPKM